MHGKIALWKHTLSVAAFLVATALLPAQAAIVTFQYDIVFSSGAVAPDGPTPYFTATFDDSGGMGSVTLTMTVSSDVGGAFVKEAYFNLDPNLDATQLIFTRDSGTGPTSNISIDMGVNAFMSDGDGSFDVFFKFPKKKDPRFQAGEDLVYTIVGISSLTASSFNFLSDMGGGEGTFLAAVKFNSTGPTGNDSAWVGVGVVPVPAAVWLFGSGLLLGLVGVARKHR